MNSRKLHRTPFEEADAVPKKLGSEIKAKIGQQLRAMYADVVSQGVPDRFTEILRKLDEKSSAQTVTADESPSREDSSTGERSDGPPR
jgi:hypothetical protein